MKAVVFGGRDFHKIGFIWRALDYLHEKHNFSLVIDGKATGVDTIAHKWALHNNIDTVREPADWASYGKKAGRIRNELMITKYKPEIAIAFPGGPGTANMTELCLDYGIDLKYVRVKNAN